MLNSVVLVGRLTADPELRYANSGTAVANFTLAVNRPYKKEGQQEADFIRIVVWRQQAENCAKYLSKGAMVGIKGSLAVRSYEDREGQRKTIAEVVAESVQFLESKKSEQQNMSEASDCEQDVPF